jgi:hypothetical protein
MAAAALFAANIVFLFTGVAAGIRLGVTVVALVLLLAGVYRSRQFR